MFKPFRLLEEIAKDNGWTYRGRFLGFPKLSGEYKERPFILDFGDQVGFLFERRQRTLLTMPVKNSAHVTFSLQGELLASFKTFASRSCLQTGDKAFDQLFYLTGRPESRVLQLFDEKIRRDLHAATMRMGGMSVEMRDQTLSYGLQILSFGSLTVDQALTNILDIVSDLAVAIEKM